ncbi:MAG TPA: hypothetical protein VKS20_11645 [Candidatus Acidoferrales bacterium]|nr:hypothetical protein [Candidatus Acidoferrales bacterium]
MSCAICEKRPPKRFCPAKGERICAICCGTYREVTIECPSDCTHLFSARRYEIEHRKAIEPDAVPFPDVEFSMELLRRNPEALSAAGIAILKFAQENDVVRDPEILAAVRALAETYRTLESGIYFERPPDAPLPRTLYAYLAQALQEFKKQEAQHSGFSKLKDSDIFRLLVFLLRVGTRETNGRPRSRAFLDFLRAQFPASSPAPPAEQSRIILP